MKRRTPSSAELPINASFGSTLRVLRLSHGLTQQDLAVLINQDKWFISRLESGKTASSESTLINLCQAMKLSPDEAEQLTLAHDRDHGSSSRPVDLHTTSLQLETVIRSAQALRLGGNPRLAYDLVTSQLFTFADTIRSLNKPLGGFEFVLTQVVELALEQIKAALDFMTKSQVKSGVLDKTLKIQALFARHSGESVAATALGLAEEAVLYSQGRIKEAQYVAVALLGDIPEYSPWWTSEVLRSAAINSGMVQDTDVLRSVYSALNKYHELLSADQRAFVLEGLVRGNSSVRDRVAFAQLEEVESLYEQTGSIAPVRTVQLARSHAVAELNLVGRLSGRTTDLLENAMEISKSNKYEKYMLEIDRLLMR